MNMVDVRWMADNKAPGKYMAALAEVQKSAAMKSIIKQPGSMRGGGGGGHNNKNSSSSSNSSSSGPPPPASSGGGGGRVGKGAKGGGGPKGRTGPLTGPRRRGGPCPAFSGPAS